MHITAVCPLCRTSYQVSPTLRGQQIRCPNTLCRKVFTVQGPEPGPASGPGNTPVSRPPTGQRSGSVGDMVPILPVEAARGEGTPPAAPPVRSSQHVGDMVPLVEAEAAQPPEPPAQAPFWYQAPPPVRRPAGDGPAPPTPTPPRPQRPPSVGIDRPALPAATPTAPPLSPAQPRELPPGTWEPPPIRRGDGTEPTPAAVGGPEAHPDEIQAPRTRRARGVVIALFVIVAGVLGAGAWFVKVAFWQTEAQRAAAAEQAYKEGQFGKAETAFKEVADKFPESEQVPRYRFMEKLSALRASLAAPETDVGVALDSVEAFLEAHKKDPLLKEYSRDVGAPLVKRLTEAFAQAESNPGVGTPLKLVARAERLLRAAQKTVGKEAITSADLASVDAGGARVRTAVARNEERNTILRGLALLPPSARGIQDARHILARQEANFPGLGKSSEVATILDRLYQGHFKSIVYESGGAGAEKPPREEDVLPSIVFDPVVGGTPPVDAPDDDPICLALSRGVLYALKRSNGEVKWAMRVGIDTTTLPVRVPATAADRERILVLSADTETLTALDADGNQVWRYRLGAPCLGRPVVIGQVAYVPTAGEEGHVYEIELAQGRLVGRYRLGQRLSRGGTREGDSSRLYFAADDSCVYVLDVKEHRCLSILYTGHPAGSLRSEPLVIPPVSLPGGARATGYLVLNQTQGLDAMQLRVWDLPLPDGPGRGPITPALKSPPRLRGWTWFRPYQDSEKLVILSDEGMLGLFGIRQANTQDPALFPMLDPGGINLAGLLAPTARERGRSQVVQVQGEDFWVLAYGKLQRLQLAWDFARGPQPIATWPQPRVLGSPLHDQQVYRDPRDGRVTLFLVTQPLHQQTCLATAVADEDGRVRWQRQLGMVSQGRPLLLRRPGGGDPVVLALDQGGGLYALDPADLPPKAGGAWRSAAQHLVNAGPLDDNPAQRPLLLPGGDGQSAYEVACPGGGTELVIRHVTFVGGRLQVRTEQRVALPAGGLAGTPAVVGSMLLMPLATGTVGRVPLAPSDPPAMIEEGPDWRDARAGAEARGHVVALGGDRFLTTNGARGVSCWSWPELKGVSFSPLPKDSDPPTLELKDRPIVPPLLLPPKAGTSPRVVVADAAGALTLLELKADGSLAVVRSWDLGGKITGGPFLRHGAGGSLRLGCVVNDSTLTWLDPDQKDLLWSYSTPGGEGIVGEPELVEGQVVVADQAGRFVALNEATGEPRGRGYRLRGSVAPAVSPVPFGPNRLLAPLTDGTALLLPLDHLGLSLREFLYW